LFYHDKDKALVKMNDIIVDQINDVLYEYDELPLLVGNKLFDLQSILSLVIKLKYGLENYEENRFEVSLNKFVFEDEKLV
jgi:hypothetical protein